VKLSISRNNLLLSAASPEQGQAQEELDGDSVAYESSPLEIGFQARYLTDITSLIGDEVQFLFADGAAPTIVKDEAKPEALYVLMPMRV
jgi:DNA polymerase-3 subunit beta